MRRLPVRSIVAAALTVTAAPSAAAQEAPSAAAQEASPDSARVVAPAPRAETTVPLPNGRGVFYYRAGPPGGVRIRSRNGRRPDTSAVAPRPLPVLPGPGAARPSGDPGQSVSRLDLLILEQNLLDAIDRRLAALEGGRRAQPGPAFQAPAPGPVLVVPPPPAAVTPPPSPDRPPAVTPAPVGPPPPAVPAPTPEPGAVTVEEVERSILETGLFRTTAVHFEFDRAALLPVSERALDVVATVLRDYPVLRIEIGGHTDAIGSEAYNDGLSQRRAESVVDALVARGVDRARLSAVGYGERRPVATNANETGRALNRRVEFTVLNPEATETLRRSAPEPNGDALRDLIRDEIERARRDDG